MDGMGGRGVDVLSANVLLLVAIVIMLLWPVGKATITEPSQKFLTVSQQSVTTGAVPLRLFEPTTVHIAWDLC